MKAAVVREYGPYEQIEIGELPDPAPAAGELVIELEASEVNFPDILHVEGRYQVKLPRPFAPGLGGAGRVSAIGDGISEFTLGQKVMVLPLNGTHAQKVLARPEWCFPIPDDVPFDVAAALGLVYQTAWFGLTERAWIAPGDKVLVLGATGGIGMAAIQLAKALGAGKVIAASRGGKGAAVARELGADAAIDTAVDDIADSLRDGVKSATDGHGADIVIDPVGGSVAEAALRALAWQGRYVVIGFASGEITAFKANYLLVKNITVSGLQWTDYRTRQLSKVRAAQERIWQLWRDGLLNPHISRRLPLERIREAFREIEAGRARGKIILLPQAREERGAEA